MRLIVMRHAKSAWNTDAQSDHDRPLNKRGRRDAPRVAARLAELGWIPDKAVSSDSQRTRETWARMSERLPAGIAVAFLRPLYLATPATLRGVLATELDVATGLVLGHNPGVEELVRWLTGEAVAMKTACAALLELDADGWKAGLDQRGDWDIATVIRPRELDD